MNDADAPAEADTADLLAVNVVETEPVGDCENDADGENDPDPDAEPLCVATLAKPERVGDSVAEADGETDGDAVSRCTLHAVPSAAGGAARPSTNCPADAAKSVHDEVARKTLPDVKGQL